MAPYMGWRLEIFKQRHCFLVSCISPCGEILIRGNQVRQVTIQDQQVQHRKLPKSNQVQSVALGLKASNVPGLQLVNQVCVFFL